ncbi:MAG: outer membrane lipoprotein chaperone LolA [Gammaproteobacteria bacterium]|jgi:outer membrane lipoprotein carrier protein|nr:outer membrane lipoprotein chaperone LolA [Gammaproteobacteria bacterium]
MSKVSALVTAVLGFCLLAGAAWAEDTAATDQLLARLNRISYLQGEFTQRQYGEGDTVIAESSGAFKLLRPFFFSWEIRAPDSQLIVANAEYLWHYDIDLQTATRHPVVGNVEASPLQILGGDESALRDQYTVTQDADNTFTLVPLGDGHSFRRLSVTFAGDTIGRMDIVDKLGQRVVVDFKRVDATTPLSSGDFEFTPPAEGVDLFYYDD